MLAQLILGMLILASCDSFPRFPSAQLTTSPTRSESYPIPAISTTAAASPTTVTPIPVSTIDVSADSLRGQIIRFWHPWTGETGRVIEDLTREFNLNNPYGILVTSLGFSGYDLLNEKINASLGTSEAPQAAAAFQHQALFWDQSHKIIDLAPYVGDPEWGMKPDEQSDFYPNIWQQGIVDEKRLGIPAYRLTQMLYYNVTWAKELGYPNPPISPDDFLQQACAAAQANLQDDNAENNGTGGWLISTEASTTLGWLYSFNGQILKTPIPDKIRSVYQFHTPENEEALVFLRELYDRGCAFLNQNSDIAAAFAQRQALFASGSVAEIPQMTDTFRGTESGDDWKVLGIPSIEGEPSLEIFGPDIYILESSPEQQLGAWIFIRWLTQPENNAQLIESIGALPVRKSTLDKMRSYGSKYPQWVDAAKLIEFGHGEPAYASWGAVRRAVSDAATQLYRAYFSVELVPAMLDYLDLFAAELHLGPDLGNVFPKETSTVESSEILESTPTPGTTPKTVSPTETRTPEP